LANLVEEVKRCDAVLNDYLRTATTMLIEKARDMMTEATLNLSGGPPVSFMVYDVKDLVHDISAKTRTSRVRTPSMCSTLYFNLCGNYRVCTLFSTYVVTTAYVARSPGHWPRWNILIDEGDCVHRRGPIL